MKINSISNQYYNNRTQNVLKQTPNFKGATVPEPIVNGLSSFYEKVAGTDTFRNVVHKFSKSDKTFTHIMVVESAILSTFYTISALRNKKIKKEQKPQMVINDALTFGVSAAGSYLLDGQITKLVNKAVDNYLAKHKDFYSTLTPEAISKTKSGFNKIKTLAIFGMIYRYIGPVLVTPLANKISAKLFEKKDEKKA